MIYTFIKMDQHVALTLAKLSFSRILISLIYAQNLGFERPGSEIKLVFTLGIVLTAHIHTVRFEEH